MDDDDVLNLIVFVTFPIEGVGSGRATIRLQLIVSESYHQLGTHTSVADGVPLLVQVLSSSRRKCCRSPSKQKLRHEKDLLYFGGLALNAKKRDGSVYKFFCTWILKSGIAALPLY